MFWFYFLFSSTLNFYTCLHVVVVLVFFTPPQVQFWSHVATASRQPRMHVGGVTSDSLDSV